MCALVRIAFYFTLAFLPVIAYALDPDRSLEEYKTNHWGVDEQLPQVYVTALEQDRKGYIWIGTQSGLARFNGKEFIHFDRSNTAAIKSNVINDLLIDKQGNLWILTDAGLTLLNNKGFVTTENSQGAIVKPHQLIEQDGEILISSSSGLYQVINNTIIPYLLSSACYALKSSSKGLVIGGRGELSFLEKNTITTKSMPKSFSKAIINDIQEINEEIWLATSMGLLIYSEGIFKPITGINSLSTEPTNALYLDENQILWVASNTGTYRIKDHKLHHDNNLNSYPNVSEFLLDREGTLWLGTLNRGLFQLMNSWSVRYSQDHGISENLIWSVAGIKLSNLYVGSDSGVYKHEKGVFKLLISKEQLPNPSAYTLLIDDDKSLWVGTKGGLAHFSDQGAKIEETHWNNLLGLQVNAIFRDSERALWVLTEQGVYRNKYDEIKKTQSKTIENVGQKTKFENSTFRAITELNDRIYLGSHVGLLSYDKNGELKVDNDIRLKTFITTLNSYKNQLIVGTYSSGLFINSKNNWINLSKENGLIFDTSFSINQLNESFWVSGFDGVYRFSFKSLNDYINGNNKVLVAEPVLKDSGYFPGSQKAYCCNGSGHAKSVIIDNNLWFPTRNGVLKLEPDKVIKNKQLVTTVIEKIGKPEYSLDLYHYPIENSIDSNIYFDERDIRISYIGLTSLDQDLVKYRYRLRGYSNKWIENDSKRNVSYTNLHHGKYIFEVNARNNNGLWSNRPTQLDFTISPRYYETNFFRLILIFIILAILFGLYKLAIYRSKIKVENLEAKIAEKTKALVISNIKLAEANEKLSVYSYTDSLTGIYNRRYLNHQILGDISHYIRLYQDTKNIQSIVFLMIDIDFFKTVNDDYGHQSGDEVLKQFVSCLKSNIRDGDYLIRWGGEEFLIVLRPDHVSSVEEMCSRLLSKIANTSFLVDSNKRIKLTTSIGYCFYPLLKQVTSNWLWSDAIDIADKGLYQAKSDGRNQWVGYQLLPSVIDDLINKRTCHITFKSFKRFSDSDPQ